MIDPEGTGADLLRTLWVWFLISPALQPLLRLLPELGLIFGVAPPHWSGLLLGGLAASKLVTAGERRYLRLLVAAFATVIAWTVLTSALGLSDARVYGSPRLVLAQFLLWISAVSLAVAVVFRIDWGSYSVRG